MMLVRAAGAILLRRRTGGIQVAEDGWSGREEGVGGSNRWRGRRKGEKG